MKFTGKLTFMLSLLLLLSLITLLKGCGSREDQAPHGSSISISPTESAVTGFSFFGTFYAQPYIVQVRDSEGKPMNGIDVIVHGGFAVPNDPQLYTFYLGNVPQNNNFRCKTNYFGICNFSVLIPAQVSGGPLWDPVNAAFTEATVGASLTPGATYYYRVSALNPAGQTFASAETSITLTVAQSAVNVNWNAVTGATGYRVFGRAAGAELFIGLVGAGVTTFLDDGSITPAGALPASNSTQLLTPVNTPFTAGAGSLDDGTYYYRVSATNAVGETLASAETFLAVSGGAASNGIFVSWNAVTGATGYNIYGRTTGGELFIGSVVAPLTTFLDDGSVVTPAGALPVVNDTQLSDPTNAAFTGTTIPGLVLGGRYCYRITALDANVPVNETAASTESCITLTGSNNAVNVNWNLVVGATGYNIYGRLLLSETLLATVMGGGTTTYLDNGSATPDGVTLPPAVNNSSRGLILNVFHDDITVSSGSATAESTISFNE